MNKPHRIACGALTFLNDTVLLVRYERHRGGTYLVGPGGALKENENIVDAVSRETREETGVTIAPRRVVVIEDLECSDYKMSKTWMTCEYIDGTANRTSGAEREGIIEVGWFTRRELANETVFPTPLMEQEWRDLQALEGIVYCLPSRGAQF